MGRKAKTVAPSIETDEDTPAGPILEAASASYGETPPALERDETAVEDEEPVVKPKKKLTEKQIEALTAGRNKGLELKKQSKEITTEKNEILTKVKEMKTQDKLQGKKEAVEDLKKYVESAELRKHVADLNSKFDSISTQFNSYLTEKQQRKLDKQNNVLETTVRDAVPRAVSKLIYEDRLRSEQGKYNPYMGRV